MRALVVVQYNKEIIRLDSADQISLLLTDCDIAMVEDKVSELLRDGKIQVGYYDLYLDHAEKPLCDCTTLVA